jgi:hypothetical protein
MNSEKTYEMLWDCPFCGARKLLGLTHRHCPSCGAPQDPGKRYFPPDDQKVAVEDHQYTGADLLCPACQTANGRAAKHCGNCGSPLDGAKGAQLLQEQVVPDHPVPPAPAVAAKPKGSGKVLIGCAVAALALVVLAIIGFFALNSVLKKDAALKVVGHSWTHEIAVETYELTRDSSPCSKMPSSAERVTREKQEPVCETRKIDQGDGTFKEKRECRDREDKCTYFVGKWKPKRTEKKSGSSVTDAMPWPSVTLSRTGTCEGCEREGKKTANYTVRFQDSGSGKEQACSFDDAAKWKSFQVGSSWKGQVGGLTGGIDCGSLAPNR